jgi:hypothetical protein
MVVQSHDGPPAGAMMGAEVSQFEFLSATKPFAGGTINGKWGSVTSGEQKKELRQS